MNKIKLKNITLKNNLELYKLSEYVEIPICDLIERILTPLVKLEYLADIKEECGERLIDILGENYYDVRRFCQNTFKIWTPKLESYLNEVFIWGYYDCPDCGCELEYKGLFNDKIGTCNNCGYEHGSNYFPDDYRDDCHKELINNINYN